VFFISHNYLEFSFTCAFQFKISRLFNTDDYKYNDDLHNRRTAKLLQLSAVSSEPCVSSSLPTFFRLTIGRTKPAGIEILMDFTLIK